MRTDRLSALVNDAGEPPVYGDSLDVVRTITDVPEGQTVTQGWLTVKRPQSDPDIDAAILLRITTSAAAPGRITTTGDGTVLTFHIEPSDYTGITAGFLYTYDIQSLTSGGRVRTHELGTINWQADVTREIAHP